MIKYLENEPCCDKPKMQHGKYFLAANASCHCENDSMLTLHLALPKYSLTELQLDCRLL